MDLDNYSPSGNGHPGAAPGGGLPQPGWQDAGIDPHEYLRILSKRKWSILLSFLGVFVSAAAYVYSQPRIYRATAKVQVVQLVPPVIISAQNQGSPQVSLNTQAKFIRSSITARKACELASKGRQVALTPEEIGSGLSVVVEEPDILAISVEHTDPERAALIANTLQDAYIDQNTALARAETTSAKKFLEDQMQMVKGDTQRTEVDIREFRERYKVPDSLPQAAAEAAGARGMSLPEAQMEIVAAEAELAGLRRRLADEPETRKVKRAVEDPVTEGLRQAMIQTEVELARAEARYEDTHPRVLALKDEVARVRPLVEARASTGATAEVEEPNPAYQALTERISDQELRIEVQKARAQALASEAGRKVTVKPAKVPKAYMELTALERSREIGERAYVQLLEQLQQVRLNEAQQQGSARKVDEAAVPKRPVRPNPGRTLLIAAIVGMLAGLSLALMQEFADTGVHDPDQLMQRTGLSSLGFIPAAREPSLTAKIAARSPRSPISEGFRTIRSNLKFSHLDSPLRTIMVTSAGAGEGKSFTATNLGIVFAQSGLSTLVIDADLRRPTLHRTFAIHRSPGLTDVLAGEVALLDAIQTTDVENLRVMASGPVPPNPAELLDSGRMAQVIEDLKEQADIVIFDTPPALVVTDAVVLSPRVDAMILVIEQGRVSSRAIAEIRRVVEQARGKVAGAVFNKVRIGASGYYYHHYYRYYYYYGDRGRKGRQRTAPLQDLPETPEEQALPRNGGSGEEV